MTLSQLQNHLPFELLAGTETCEITGGYTSDLLSDVMANAQPGDLLITIQAHKNTIAVASHVELPAIVICSNRSLPDDALASAQEHGITVCRTSHDQFTVSGILYALLQ